MLVRLVQFRNADSLIAVTLSGIVILVRLLQLENISTPKIVNWQFSAKMTLVRAVQSLKAHSPTLVIPFPIVILVRPVQAKNAFLSMSVTLFGIEILVRPMQLENALGPMLFTLSGMMMLVRLLQEAKAEISMAVTLPSFGMTLVWHPAIRCFFGVSIKQFPSA